MKGLIAGIPFVLFALVPMRSQTVQKPSFEVSSVKAIQLRSAVGPVRVSTSGDRFTASNATVRSLLAFAYRGADGRPLSYADIIGVPDWAEMQRFDVEAKASEAAQPEQMQLMVQALLADRFQLRVHWTQREGADIFNLVITKDGPKLKLSDDQSAPPAAPPSVSSKASELPPRGQMRQTANMATGAPSVTVVGAAVPIKPDIVGMLQAYAGRPIIDKTGLKGLFDFQLRFVLNSGPIPGTQQLPAASEPAGPTIFTALQEQLGLKLESGKGSVEVLVIDSVQKPTEN
jgi:uncharacterized protein (TIGR03435 family)